MPIGTDVDLIERIRRRDESAMAELYDAYAEPLLALGFRILQDRAEAEDVVLEALAGLWHRAAAYDPERGSVRAFLAVAVRHRAIDIVRKRRRHGERRAELANDLVEALGGDRSAGTPADRAEAEEARRLVRAALAGLPPLQRQAIELAYYGGYSQSEIARQLDAPLGTVKTRIRDGMHKLRGVLQPLFREQSA